MDITERTDLLFRTIKKPDGKEYSYRDVQRLSDGAISSTAVWQIRTGKTENPTQRTLRALSEAFQVPISYFFDEGVTPDDVPEYRDQYRTDKLVEKIALRAHELDDEGKQAILDMIDYVRGDHDLNTEPGGERDREDRGADASPAG